MIKRDPDTIFWLLKNGIQGLSHKPGRGRKPAFSPKSSRSRDGGPQYMDRIPDRSIDACRGSTMFPCRVFIKSSHDWVSAINDARAYVWSPDTLRRKNRPDPAILEETRPTSRTSCLDEFILPISTVAKVWARQARKHRFNLSYGICPEPTHRRRRLSKLHRRHSNAFYCQDLPTLSRELRDLSDPG